VDNNHEPRQAQTRAEGRGDGLARGAVGPSNTPSGGRPVAGAAIWNTSPAMPSVAMPIHSLSVYVPRAKRAATPSVASRTWARALSFGASAEPRAQCARGRATLASACTNTEAAAVEHTKRALRARAGASPAVRCTHQ
jgi:hypothetical protein